MLNKVQVIGRLGKDPEIRHTQAGKAIASFTLASSETWKDKSGEKQEKTEWFNVVCFSEGLSNVIEKWVHKGDLIYVEGKLQTRTYEKDGATKYVTEVVLDGFNGTMKMLGGTTKKEGGEDKPAPAKAKAKPKAEPEYEDLSDEVPF